VAVEPTGRIPAYMITRENMPEEFVRGAELAIIDFDTAIKRNPKLFSAYFNKGVILKIIGREREAVPIFEKAIKLGLEKRVYSSPTVANEDDVEFVGTGHPMMTMSGIRKYLIDEKLSFKRKEGKIVILSRTNPFISNENDAIAFAYYHQGSALASANMKDYPKALSCFDKAIEQNPNIPTFYAVKGVIYAGLGNADQMFENLNQQKALMDRIIRIKNSEE
jgi:tetratricopeptide (TPR) repeat protein